MYENDAIETIECIKLAPPDGIGETLRRSDSIEYALSVIRELYSKDLNQLPSFQDFLSDLNFQKYRNSLSNQNINDEEHKLFLLNLNRKLQANIDTHKIQMPLVSYHAYPKHEFSQVSLGDHKK